MEEKLTISLMIFITVGVILILLYNHNRSKEDAAQMNPSFLRKTETC